MEVSIDIILPAYNPNNNWYLELLNFYESVSNKYTLNFIIVNDGSESNDLKEHCEMLKRKQVPITLLNYSRNMGKGYALRHGVKHSQSWFIIYTDIDFPFTNRSVFQVMDKLINTEVDIVAGNRNGNYYLKSMSYFRKLLSKSFRFFLKNILSMPITDTQCGLKGFNEQGKKMFLKTTINRYLFDFEFIYLASRNKKLKVVPIEVELKNNVIFSKMKLKVLLQESYNLIKILGSRNTVQ